MRDYKLHELKTVLSEQVEDVYYRTRRREVYPITITANVGYADGGGIRKQFTEKNGYKSTTVIIEKLWDHISERLEEERLYRTLGVSFNNFKSSSIQQLELFKDEKEYKSEMIDYALDKVKAKYGKEIVLRATSLTKSGTLLER